MTDIHFLREKVIERFADDIVKADIHLDELTVEVRLEKIKAVCLALRDHPDFNFNLLVDVCGVDYLHYGLSDWETQSATESGFSRGVTRLQEEGLDCFVAKSAPRNDDHERHCEPRSGEAIQGKGVGCFVAKSAPRNDDSAKSAPRNDDSANGVPCYDDVANGVPCNDERARFAVVYHLLSVTRNHRVRLRVSIPNDAELIIDSVMDIWPSADWFEREVFDLFGILFRGHPDLRRLLTDYGFVGHPFRKDFPLIGKVEARYDAALRRVIYEPVSIQPRILEPKVIRHDHRYLEPNRESGDAK